MPNRRWKEYLASLGLLGTEFGKAIEGVVGGPELHNQRVYVHVVSAGLWGRTTSRVAGLPLALSFPVDEAPPELSVTEFVIDADTLRARLTTTDVVIPVDLGGVPAAASAEGAGAAAALLALLTNFRP